MTHKTNKMKLLLIILSATVILSCTQNSDPTTIVAGHFANLDSDSIFLLPVDEYFPGKELPLDSYSMTRIDSQGNYKFKIPEFESGFYQIVKGKHPQLSYDIFIEAGDSLYIYKPAWNSEDHLQISGSGSEKLDYLNTDSKKYPLRSIIYDTIRTKGFATELLFKEYLDSIYTQRIQTLETNRSTPLHLKKRFRNSLIAEKSKLLLEHLDRRNYIMNEEFDYYYPDSAYYEFKKELAQIDSNTCNTQLYDLANPLLTHRARLAFQNKTEEEWWDEKSIWKMEYLKSRSSSLWKDILIISSTYDYSMELSSPLFFKNLKILKTNSDSTYTSTYFNDIFSTDAQSVLSLAPGEKAPDFTLPDAKGNSHSLSDYLGSIVYIDFWGTWCYPCIQEIPDALQLQEKYKDEPVKFIYVSMEYDQEDIDNWKNFIAGKDNRFGKITDYKPFTGIHLVAEKQMRNPEISPYKINFAPTHVLVDAEGKIVHPRAKRSNEISAQIDSLLNK